MQLQAISLGFYTDAQWTSFPSFCQRCYSSLTELLTEMGHYTEAIKRYLTRYRILSQSFPLVFLSFFSFHTAPFFVSFIMISAHERSKSRKRLLRVEDTSSDDSELLPTGQHSTLVRSLVSSACLSFNDSCYFFSNSESYLG